MTAEQFVDAGVDHRRLAGSDDGRHERRRNRGPGRTDERSEWAAERICRCARRWCSPTR